MIIVLGRKGGRSPHIINMVYAFLTFPYLSTTRLMMASAFPMPLYWNCFVNWDRSSTCLSYGYVRIMFGSSGEQPLGEPRTHQKG